MNKYYLGLKFALSYFTTLPVRFREEEDLSTKDVLNSMLFFLPFIGFVLGFLTLISLQLLSSLQWVGWILAALLYMLLYGFLHTEAIIDVVDALYAKHSGKDAYKVIKEPTIGAMGLLYVVAFVTAKISIIVFIFQHALFFYFLSTLILSRLMLLYLIRFNSFKSSFVTTLKESLSSNSLIFATLFGVIVTFFLIGFDALLLFCIALIASFFLINTFKKHLGFLNGDTLGATLELTELVLLLFLGIFFL